MLLRQSLSLLSVILLSCITVDPSVAGDVLRDMLLPTVPKDTHIVAHLPCPLLTPGVDVLCVVKEKNDTSSVAEWTRLLEVFRVNAGGLKKLYQFESDYGLDSIGMVRPGILQAVWQTGSAFYVTVFRGSGKESIRLILEQGAESYPEYADLYGDGQIELILSESEWVRRDGKEVRAFTKATIYELTNGTYKRVRTVPWNKRFQPLPPRVR